MKKDIIPLGIVFLLMVSVVFVYTPSLHLWKSEYDRSVDWCEINLPIFNDSSHKRVAFCFGDGWKDYCNLSYPGFCPDNDFTDYDRCLRNCVAYGGDCPC